MADDLDAHRSTFTYPQAAVQLGCTEYFLRRRITTIPHLKLGKRVLFTLAHLEAIKRQFEQRPEPVDLRPSSRRRRSG